jgi:hypothetical protein
VQELADGEVDRHARRVGAELAAPRRELLAGEPQHPRPDGDDQARVLGGRQELGGLDQFPARPVPPRQTLEARDRAVAHVDDRLVVDDHLVALDRPP